jgi:hypothetical protein
MRLVRISVILQENAGLESCKYDTTDQTQPKSIFTYNPAILIASLDAS